MDDLMRHLTQRTELCIYEDIGLPIKWTADFQKLVNLREWIGIVQKRPVRLAFDPLPDLFG